MAAVALLGAYQLQAQPLGHSQSGYHRSGNTFTFQTTEADIRLEFCNPDMFRVRASWDGVFEDNESFMVVRYNWDNIALEVIEAGTHFKVSTDSMDVVITKSPFALSVYRKDGTVISEGIGAERVGKAVSTSRKLQPDEYVFGFGERMDFISQRNKKLTLNVGRGKGQPHEMGAYNILEANYSPVPFFMSTKGYGIFLHNSFATEWDMGYSRDDEYCFGAVDGELDYYFIYGPKLSNILNHYTTLTGKSPMLPRFAFGLHAGTYSGGTWGYEELTSDDYVIALARKFRELGIPIDILWLDSTWRIFGEIGGKGATSFEWRETFNNPKGMFDSLYAMHYGMVGLHLRPRFDNGKTMNLLDRARERGFVYPEPDEYGNEQGEFVNFFDQKSVDWWWDNGVKKVADLGAMFLKTDEGSAFGGIANESDKTGPTDKVAEKLHNIFPIAYAKAPYEKFQESNGIRGLNHTREGYAGIQRYPFIFAGDWPSEWQYFLPVIRAGLNIGLSGVGYWTHCMGGFEHPADPELYIRWVQFGMFSPIAMVFGMDHPGYKEPWNYGDEAFANFKKYDQLRYRLIPYIYSNAYQLYRTGVPLMKALVMEYQEDKNVYHVDDQYLFGDDLLVCPVVTKGAKTRTVYLPEGKWFDYWTGRPYEGKQYIHVATPLDVLPIFAKAGAIIPMQADMDYIGEKPVDEITLDIFPEADGYFEYYEDDGKSLDYQQGEHTITQIRSTWAVDRLELNIHAPKGDYQAAKIHYVLKIRSGQHHPEHVHVNGMQLSNPTDGLPDQTQGWYYDPDTAVLWINTGADNGQDNQVVIQFQYHGNKLTFESCQQNENSI